MNTEKIYKGNVISVRQIGFNSLGIRNYEINFATGKAIFSISSKRTMPIVAEEMVYFTGNMIAGYFLIDKVVYNYDYQYSQEQEDAMYSQEQEKIIAAYSAEQMEGLANRDL